METFALTIRTSLYPFWILYALIFCICLLSIIKYKNEVVFTNIGQAFIKSPSTVPFSKSEIGVFGWVNWVFIVNYFVVSSLGCYMAITFFNFSNYLFVLTPIILYFLHLFSIQFIGWISGEKERIKEVIVFLNVTYHAIGILLLPILFIWVVNPEWSQELIYSVLFVYIIVHLFRILKSISIALRKKIWWYYIILYLCGLEIWPIILVATILSPNFLG